MPNHQTRLIPSFTPSLHLPSLTTYHFLTEASCLGELLQLQKNVMLCWTVGHELEMVVRGGRMAAASAGDEAVFDVVV